MNKPLENYLSLSDVPLDHPDVKYECIDPSIYCKDAVGLNGCLAKDHTKITCKYIVEK